MEPCSDLKHPKISADSLLAPCPIRNENNHVYNLRILYVLSRHLQHENGELDILSPILSNLWHILTTLCTAPAKCACQYAC